MVELVQRTKVLKSLDVWLRYHRTWVDMSCELCSQERKPIILSYPRMLVHRVKTWIYFLVYIPFNEESYKHLSTILEKAEPLKKVVEGDTSVVLKTLGCHVLWECIILTIYLTFLLPVEWTGCGSWKQTCELNL